MMVMGHLPEPETVSDKLRFLLFIFCPKSIAIAAAGFDKTWKPKSERISQRYTTEWGELVCVK